ncbi:MAG: DUF1080 domain-containing protein [Planctomycetia bacterium]|nr:DUF1080 domain-containing protein [Planctomycetia bacterium]
MNIISSMILCAVFSWTLPSDIQVAEGWVALFDGETTFGWNTETPNSWQVEEGTLLGAGPSKIETTTQFKNVKFQYEIQRCACEPWETVTGEITDGTLTLEVPEGKAWSFRNVLLKPKGMEAIFNGENLDGWKTYPEMAGKFTVNPERKTLDVKDGLGMLETEKTYGDFAFQCAVSLQPKVNSGVFFRCIPGEKLNGYECQLNNTLVDGDRTKPADAGSGAIFRRTVARYVPATDPEIFYVTIIARGDHISTWVNGMQQTDWTDTRKANPNPRRGLRVEPGTIMLQAHDVTTDGYFQSITINSWD